MKKDIDTIKKSEMENIICEMKTREGISNKLDEAEAQIRDLEDKVAEHTQSEQQKGRTIFRLRIV